nr:hypothetical protein [Planctomycetota bacterium]
AGDGDKRIRAPRPMRWVDARCGRTLAAAAAEVTVRMTRGQTLLLEIEPA